MIYSIENRYLKISVDTMGAQLMSLKSKKTGTEYLWQGDKTYWGGRAYNLFPIIGRLTNGEYELNGKKYFMRPHGIARYSEFELYEKTENSMENALVFRLCDSVQTREQYPFSFEYFVEFLLSQNRLKVTYRVKNTGKTTMLFGIGGHPGINVPFGGGKFEDYYLEFDEANNVLQHTLAESKMMSGETVPFALKTDGRLPLRHNLFDNDAVILENTGSVVTVRGKNTDCFVRMSYSGFKYIGLWHPVATDAPLVCLEPWSVLPSQDGKIEVLEKKQDVFHLPSYETKTMRFLLEIGE